MCKDFHTQAGLHMMPLSNTYHHMDTIQKKPGLWTYDSSPITFTLEVDNFGVKYSGKKHTLHIKAYLEGKYKVTTDWYEKIYVGISLTWNYYKGTVQLAMPRYF